MDYLIKLKYYIKNESKKIGGKRYILRLVIRLINIILSIGHIILLKCIFY